MPVPQPKRISVTMPNGAVVRDVPADITRDELWARYTASMQPQTPIDKAVAGQEDSAAILQAQKQQAYEARQAQLDQFEKEHPEAKVGADIMREPAPTIDPSLAYYPPLPPSPVQKFGTATKIGLLEDQETQRRVMAKALFPDDPDAMDRVGFYDGKAVYIDDKGQMQQLTSGMTQFLANTTANSPEIAASLVPDVGPGLAAGVHGIKRGIASLIFDEPTEPLDNLKGMAIEGGLNLAGELPGRVVGRLGNRGTFVSMTPEQLKAAQEVQRRIKADPDLGFDVDLAQASGDRKLISARSGAEDVDVADPWQFKNFRVV